MNIALIGLLMIVVFMIAVLSKKVNVITAMVVIPVIFGFIAGFGLDTFTYAVAGMLSVDSTIALLVFAILYFGIMLYTGLFDPLAEVIIKFMKGDPLRVYVGTVILATLVSLDGDGTTTFMIVCTALLPVYDKMGLDRVWLAILTCVPNGAINLLPWGGPTARILAVLDVDGGELLVALLPFIFVNITICLITAVILGLKDRKRLGIVQIDIEQTRAEIVADRIDFSRPRYIWFNLALTIIALVSIIAFGISGPIVFALGSCIALLVNYHDTKIEKKVIESTAEGIVNIVVMILGAGVLMGILDESGMASEISNLIITALPESWGNFFTLVIAVISGPAVWLLNNDAFYLGILPVLAETATAYGFTDVQIALASLVGQGFRGFSPVIAALYFLCSYVRVEFSDYQRKIIPLSFILFGAYIVAGFFMFIYA